MLFFAMSDFILEAYKVRDEIFIQGRAMSKLMGDMRSNELEMRLIKQFGREFRGIINDFKKRYKKLPTPDDLIWIAGVHARRDPRDIVKDIAAQIRQEIK